MGNNNNFGIGVFLTLILALLVFVVLVLTGVIAFDQAGIEKLFFGTMSNQSGDTIIINESENVNLCNLYEDNFPDYIANRSTNCILASGDWRCEPDHIGCYEVPVWDHTTICPSSEVRTLRLLCSLANGEYTCDAHQVSCEN